MIRTVPFALILCALSLRATAFGAVFSNGDLTKECTQRMIVVNPKGESVGEKIDPLCSGYLQGSFQTLLSIPNLKCVSSLTNEQTPESLLSIYFKYQKDKNVVSSEPAASTLVAAYARAFGCGGD